MSGDIQFEGTQEEWARIIEQNKQNEALSQIYAQISEYDKEIVHNNECILNSFEFNDEDFYELLNDCVITDKMEWVDEPDFEPEQFPRSHGVFTVTHVDQKSVGLEGDSFAGYMYVVVEGHDKWLKIPYSC